MSDDPHYRVLVCRGVTCTGFFADDVFRAMRKEVERKGLAKIALVERGGCFGGCGGGVTVVVRPRSAADLDGSFDAYEDTVCATPAATDVTCVAALPLPGDDGDDAIAKQVVYPEVMEPDVARIVKEHLQGGRAIESMRVARRGAKLVR